jgi:isochorismate hydrolase
MSPDRGEITVLFSTDAALDRSKLHQTARSTGAQDLVVARVIVHVGELPVLWSGKTDYVKLVDMAKTAVKGGVVPSMGVDVNANHVTRTEYSA